MSARQEMPKRRRDAALQDLADVRAAIENAGALRRFVRWTVAVALLAVFQCVAPLRSAETWQEALTRMPVYTNSVKAHLTAPVQLVFSTLRPREEVRGVILMPDAADQLYFLDHGRLFLPEKSSLADLLKALTNNAGIQVSFKAPFLLLHTTNDILDDPLTVAAGGSLDALNKLAVRRVDYLDRAYDRALPDIAKALGITILPEQTDQASWHYYRLAFIGHNITGTDVLRAMAYTMKTLVRIEKDRAVFTDAARKRAAVKP